jgi:lipoate-protein ligase A
MHPIRLLNLGSIPPWQTQAVYHMLAERMTVNDPDTIVLCRPNAPYLCLGYHQVFDSVFNPVECEQRGLPVYRRRLGGGATYLDGNQLFYQCVFHHSRMPATLRDIYASTLAVPVHTLKQLGLSAELRETNEIEVNGKRVAGTGGGRIDEACVVVGNLLFDFDFDAMAAVWRTPSAHFRLLAAQALRQQIVTLNQLAISASMDEVMNLLIKSFAELVGRSVQSDFLTSEELQDAKKIARNLSSDDFLSLHKAKSHPEPMRSLKISARAFIHAVDVQADGYHVQGNFWVNHDVIQMAKLESEPRRKWEYLEEQLSGIPFKEWQEHIHVQLENATLP